MQARRVCVTGPYQVTVEEFELPEAPPSGQVLLATERTLISAGTELAIMMGTHIGFSTVAAWPRYPMALGYTAVGRVLATGADVTSVAVGDRVLAPTPHASHAVTDVGQLQRLPSDFPADGALLAHLATISLNGVRLARPQLGEGMA